MELSLEENINHWNNYYKEIFSSFGNIIKLFCLMSICLSPALLFSFIPKENNSFSNIAIKKALPLFLVGFLIHGPYLYGLIYILKII